jgi:glycosyltransferase involved in cell wall biosynthesis
MKVSIVLPVYNGEETLRECLQAILDINYPKSEYELVVVNDGSKDTTEKIIKEFIPKYEKQLLDINFINFQENKGRIKARMEGARNARYENLLFIDHRCIAYKDILTEIGKKDYEPIVGNPIQDYKENLISRFFYIFRKSLYKPYWGENYSDVYIDKDNFDNIAKGFSPFFTNKERFFNSIPEDIGKWVSDDTLIFSNMVEKKKILKTSEVRCLYKERYNFKDFFAHMFQRGPRFVDFYWNPKSKYFFVIPLLFLLPLILVLGVLFFDVWFLIIILLLLLFLLGLLLFRKYDVLDITAIFLIGFLVLLSFGGGIYVGVFRKILLNAKTKEI